MNKSTIIKLSLIITFLTTQLTYSAASVSNNPSRDPILTKHPVFSDNWWNALFNSCDGCERKDSNEKIKCEKLLAANPQWEEITPIAQQVKNAITKRALERFEKTDDACSLACSLCIGGDPNTKLDKLDRKKPRTALHLSTGTTHNAKPHYGLFNLLLRHGANPNEESIDLHPLEFDILDSWKKELKERGAMRRAGKQGLMNRVFIIE